MSCASSIKCRSRAVLYAGMTLYTATAAAACLWSARRDATPCWVTEQVSEADDGVFDANHAPFELVSHDEVEDVLEVLTNASGRWGSNTSLERLLVLCWGGHGLLEGSSHGQSMAFGVMAVKSATAA